MTLMDPIGDMLTRIRNGQQRLMAKVEMPSSSLRLKILDVLKAEGFISSYYIEKKENNKISLIVDLKYYEGNPVIKDIKRISKPGRRVYSRATSIPRIQNGLGLAIISTNKGVMSDIEARKNNIGGEVICKVF
jgi:small subunit ribosomal protein S8